MTIVYAVVARGKVVLAEHTSTSGNFPTVTRVLLSKIASIDAKMSYVYDDHVFHYIVENGITYLCLCMNQEKTKRRVAFAFLEDTKIRFQNQFGSIAHRAPAFTMNEEFSKILQRQMIFYNSDPGADDLTKVKHQLDDVKSVMVENIEKVLERGEKIELLVDKTDRLNQSAFRFEKTSRQLRNALFWRKIKVYFFITALIAFAIFLLTAYSCGGFAFPNCSSSDKKSSQKQHGNKKPHSSLHKENLQKRRFLLSPFSY
uniref:V-SNARE coiled-coil homology domain-containing protein n=1 Tax=Aureoumbra lagunensis TaxID=44058 RepID=A0A7S3K3T3_9STRA